MSVMIGVVNVLKHDVFFIPREDTWEPCQVNNDKTDCGQ
jgi:hypothetical protein